MYSLEIHKAKVAALTGDDKELFEERVSICLESNVNQIQAEIIAMREVENARNQK